MPHYTSETLCNLALAGASGAGKTSLVEALLRRAGLLNQPGRVEAGNTVCDYDPLEKQYQHSLSAALVSLDHADRHINLIDTPGMPEFIGHALGVFPAVETVAVVVNAQSGVEPMTRRMLQRAAQRKLCRMLIVNKIDAAGIDLAALLAELKAEFGAECLPLNLPTQGGRAVVDCFFNPVGESDLGPVAAFHTAIVDQVVEVDEALMALYLEQGQSLQPPQLHAPFEQALREGHLIPVCFVSAETGVGVGELLEVLARLMPNPLEGNPRPFLKGEGAAAAPFYAEPDPSRHVLAHVFKINFDPFLGKLSLFRVHQGTLNKDTQLFVGDGRKPFKVGHLFKLQGKQPVEISQAIPGDLCAVAKVEAVQFDAVLHDSHEEDYIHLAPQNLPKPLYGLALQGRRGDEQRLGTALHKLEQEDPCLHLEHDPGLNQTVLRGLGELHLRVALERLASQYNLELTTQAPKIPYRETVSVAAEGHYRHKKQTGGAGQFGEVMLRVEPLPRGAGFEFVNAVTGGAIPSGFIPAVEKGVRQALAAGAVAGYPLVDLRVVVTDGKHHSVDSKEIAFVIAGRWAFLDAVGRAKPLLLEPIVSLEAVVPETDLGGVTGDLAAKRARILGTEMRPGGRMAVRAETPLSELSQYQTELKSATGGQGAYTMEFSHYEPLPPNLQQPLVAAYKPTEDKD